MIMYTAFLKTTEIHARVSYLHSGTVCHSLVGVDALVWLLAVEKILDELLHLGDAGGATNQHDLINLVLAKVGILQRLRGLRCGAREYCPCKSRKHPQATKKRIATATMIYKH
jgi:hypothetical protein